MYPACETKLLAGCGGGENRGPDCCAGFELALRWNVRLERRSVLIFSTGVKGTGLPVAPSSMEPPKRRLWAADIVNIIVSPCFTTRSAGVDIAWAIHA